MFEVQSVQSPSYDGPISFSSCAICLLAYNIDSRSQLRPEGVCYECWYKHIEAFTSQLSYKLGGDVISPFENRPPIAIGEALKSLSHQHEHQVSQMLFKKYSSFTSDIEKCPSGYCDYVYTLQACTWKKPDEQCPKCSTPLSRSIGSIGFGLKQILGQIQIQFLESKCPKCQIPIQKTTGCFHMTCKCGHQFCWNCFKDHRKTNDNIYSLHESNQCFAIVITKFIYLFICVVGAMLSLFSNDMILWFLECMLTIMLYVGQSVMLDVIIGVNIFVVCQFGVYKRSIYTGEYSIYKEYSAPLVFLTICALDYAYIFGLLYFDLTGQTFTILLVEFIIIGTVIALVFFVQYCQREWFDYIM